MECFLGQISHTFVFFYAPPRDGEFLLQVLVLLQGLGEFSLQVFVPPQGLGEFSLRVFVLLQGLGEYGGKLSGTVRERGSGIGGTGVPE